MIIKPQNDKRNYKHIILDNKLEVILISDKETSVSAASLAVNIGHYEDPEEYLGLAHFLEHMLFLGTKKYPDENYYNKYLNEHNGMSNAYTSSEQTNYYFSIQSGYLKKILDVFAQFFIDPLLSESATDREINAVDSEHSKNINSDGWRIDRILRVIAKPEHPFHKFSTGNLETLKKKDIRERLLEFHEKYYSSNMMKLVVIYNPKEDMNEESISKYVRQLFSGIENKKIVHSKYNGKPFILNKKNKLCSKLIKMVPVADTRMLNIYWQIDNMDELFDYKPTEYISNLIGHEGKGSILNILKQTGLGTSLSAGIYDNDRSMNVLATSVELTKRGFRYIPTVIDIILTYIEKILKVEEEIYNEMATISDLKFKFLKKMKPIEYVVALSANMLRYPTKYVVAHGYTYKPFESKTKKIIDEVLSKLNRKNAIIIISSKKYEKKMDTVERFYKIEYTLRENPTEYGKEFSTMKYDKGQLYLPTKNPFIPKDVSIKQLKKQAYPIKLNNKKIDVWYKGDAKYNEPRVIIHSLILAPTISETPRRENISILYNRLFDRILSSYSYYAYLADTKFYLAMGDGTILLRVDSYSDTIERVLKKLVKILSNMKITEHDYNIVKQEHKNDVKNFIYKPPYQLGLEYIKEKSYRIYHTYEELLESLDEINYKDIASIRDRIRGEVRCLIQGNITKEEATRLSSYIEKFSDIRQESLPITLVEPLKKGEEEVFIRRLYNEKETDSTINIFHEVGVMNKKKKGWEKKMVLMMLVYRLISESFFDTLRTIEQSGYIVKSTLYELGYPDKTIYGILFIIQSSKKDPNTLRKRIKIFISKRWDAIQNMSSEMINKYIETEIKKLKKPDVNIYEEFGRNIERIIKGDSVFDIRKRLIAALKNISRINVLKFYKKYMLDETTRKVRLVEMYNKNHFIDTEH